MKIVQLIDSLSAGGAERMAVNMANAFADNNISSTLVATRAEGILKSFLVEEVNYYVLHKRSSFDLVAFRQLLRIISKHQPDIIHAHSSSYFWAVLTKFFFPGVIVIWHDHQGLREKAKINHRPFLKLLSRKMNGIIVVNEVLRNWNVKHTHVPEEKIRFINNFPDPRIPSSHTRENGEINILCLANLRPEKNHPMLIQAFAKLIRELPEFNISLWLAGNVTDTAQVGVITSLIQELRIQQKVTLLGTVQDTGALLSRAHVGVLSSTVEGLPVSLLEYGLAALPVLVTDVGECREVLQNGKLGWIVASRDETAFVETLTYIIRNPEESTHKGALLKERISNIYGSKNFVFEYVTFAVALYPRSITSGINHPIPD